MNHADFGVIGLAVMGQNLALNVERCGYTVAVFNRTAKRTEEFVSTQNKGKKIIPTYSLQEFVDALKQPRKILVQVKAGPPTDTILEQVLPLLQKGDIVMDGGNAHYEDTEQRIAAAEKKGVSFLGVGISGGETGALYGPSIMVGGHKQAFEYVKEIFTKIAAKGPEGPCCAYFGQGCAGHYVKMVHNGIEYAIMETIAEAYDLMNRGLQMSQVEMTKVFDDWNKGELGSYLFEITKTVLAFVDPITKKPLTELILDQAAQKGTGKWSTQAALDMGTTAPTIAMAVFARSLSALKTERTNAEKILSGPESKLDIPQDEFIRDLFGAVILTVVAAYAQGLRELKDASRDRGFGLELAEVARVWMAGCIIQAKLLIPIAKVFKDHPDLDMMFLCDPFLLLWKNHHQNLREIVIAAHKAGIPVPAISSALNFFDGYRTGRLPANLIQAQRDLFGAHTYQRLDKQGSFHTEWEARYGA